MILSIITLSAFLTLIIAPLLIAGGRSKDQDSTASDPDEDTGTHFMKG